jgi:uncharacterized membrane protein YkgB
MGMLITYRAGHTSFDTRSAQGSKPMTTTTLNRDGTSQGPIEVAGRYLLRYGLVSILLWVGLLKFTAYEALALQPLVVNSPFMAWIYDILSVRMFSNFLGAFEIVLALLIATRPFAPKLSAIGSMGAAFLFLVTLTTLITTPGVFQMGYGVPFLSPFPGQFIAKDLGLLAIAVWTAGEAIDAGKRT